MKIEPFEMERWQSLHEHDVELNLSDSGVHPLSLRDLLALLGDDALDALLDQELEYTQTNGSPALRARVAALHPGAGPENVLVTTGGVEANCVAAWTLVEPGDEVVYVICAKGGRSRAAVHFMREQGIDAVNVGGGTAAWIESGRPVETEDQT